MADVFFTASLDSNEQRTAIMKKVQEHLSGEREKSAEVIYLGQSGWESVGRVTSLTYRVMALCRRHGLLASERSVLLSLHDQYRAIQLCLARINKNRHGEFMAAASDVLDVWNELCRDALASDGETLGKGEDSVLPSDDSYDPGREMKEIIQEYKDFMANSSCLDHFDVYRCLKKNLKQNEELQKDVLSKAYIVEGVGQMPTMERELLKLILGDSRPFQLSSAFPLSFGASAASHDLDISGVAENGDPWPADDDGSEEDERADGAISVDAVDGPLADYVDGVPRSPPEGARARNGSELYVERLILAHLRLLVNTRDELALTVACSMPGREITQQGFTHMRLEAKNKNMPMYQTILSFIMRQRLGGKGYQADPSNPVLLHAKPLGEFVDFIMKLQNVVEEEPNQKKGAVQVLSAMKRNLIRMKGCVLRRATVERVWTYLDEALGRLLDAAADESGLSPDANRTSSLQPCVKYLIHLCDEASGHVYDAGIVDALGEAFLTQRSSAQKFATPPRIPNVISLFRSPDESRGPRTLEDEDLKTRVAKEGPARGAAAVPRKYNSTCAWAPNDQSPVDAMGSLSPSSFSPIAGPSLRAVGGRKAHKRNASSSRSEGDVMATVEAEDAGGRRGKRSLLSDISNLAGRPGPGRRKSPSKKARRKVGLPSGQMAITSFFKV